MRKPLLLSSLIGLVSFGIQAEYTLERHFSVEGQAATGTFAPYYMSSNRNGMTGASPYAIYTLDGIARQMNDSARFSYGFGVDLWIGYLSKIDYKRYNKVEDNFTTHAVSPGTPFLQQLYGEVKYRSLFLQAGVKENVRSLFDSPLSVGDYTLSNNARPVPQVRLGFYDFVDVPFAKGWLQVQAELAYGKFIDNGWLRNQFNYSSSFLTTGSWMHYKRFYFRVAPSQRFTVTIGMQHGVQFGGYTRQYHKGEIVYEHKLPVTAKSFFKILLPKRGEGSEYYDGNHLGSWDLQARYRLDCGAVTFGVQFPWEDGSGIGKLNGFDGIWGLSYEADERKIIDGVTVQYIDFTNQSGPMHWAPGDVPGTGVTGGATGADDYYNNYYYDGWANYGMGLGTAFVKSPIYNTDGYPRFLDNRVRGVHIGIGGHAAERWSYRLLWSHRTSWGTPFAPRPNRLHATSFMAQCSWQAPAVEGLTVDGAVAFDVGRLYGNSFGVRVGVTYSGLMKLSKLFTKKPINY